MAGSEKEEPTEGVDRRGFLSHAGGVAMVGGLAAGYGGFAAIAARYLYPAESERTAWVYVADLASFRNGQAMSFVTPTGAKAAIARQGETGAVEDFVALSSVCPHLGCQVHWEEQNQRFFCPCHNGVFDKGGKALEGPPAAAGQSLKRYNLRVEKGLLFMEVPTEQLAAGEPVVEPQTITRTCSDACQGCDRKAHT